MEKIVSISLENDLDIPLSHKRAAKIATLLGLTLSTQTTFAAGISEACRVVIERTMNSILTIGLRKDDNRWFLCAEIKTDAADLNNDDFVYAKRLVPVLDISKNACETLLEIKMGLPRSVEVNKAKIKAMSDYFETGLSESPYEEIKRRNRELNEIVEEREEQLRLSNYLNEQKSEFLSIASHELKTPVSVIKAYSQIARSGKNNVDINDLLGRITSQTEKMHTLIQQLLDFAKIENKSMVYNVESTDLSVLIKDVISTVQSIYGEHNLVTNLPETLNSKLDRLRIEQVLINIIGNAAKYSPKGSTITVSLSSEENTTRISVKDEGIGLSPENLEKVFNKFYRAGEVKQSHSGLGMGLYIASKIVEDHNGKLWAESTLNSGSTFHVSLPDCS